MRLNYVLQRLQQPEAVAAAEVAVHALEIWSGLQRVLAEFLFHDEWPDEVVEAAVCY